MWSPEKTERITQNSQGDAALANVYENLIQQIFEYSRIMTKFVNNS